MDDSLFDITDCTPSLIIFAYSVAYICRGVCIAVCYYSTCIWSQYTLIYTHILSIQFNDSYRAGSSKHFTAFYTVPFYQPSIFVNRG